METIEVVIKMPKEDYMFIKTMVENDYETPSSCYYNIASGIVLPKGHRKLIAEPTEEDIAKTIGGKNDFADYIREAIKAVFDNASAVIEADEESEE